MLITCGKKSAGIPKAFPADFAFQSNFLRIFGFQEIPQVFPRIFLRILSLRTVSCGFLHLDFLRILLLQKIPQVTF
jgi:hypothetical protein